MSDRTVISATVEQKEDGFYVSFNDEKTAHGPFKDQASAEAWVKGYFEELTKALTKEALGL